MSASPVTEAAPEPAPPAKKGFRFPSAVTVLVLVTLFVWVAALLIPSGQYQHDEDGAPIAGSYEQVDSPLSFPERVIQLIRSPINGVYGIQDLDTGFVDTENLGALFGSIGVVVFILALGAFISVSFATRSLEVAVAGLAKRLQRRGWLLIAAVMTLFSLLGSAMGFSVETFGFYALLLPLMAAMGYDRMAAVATIILGAMVGAMASTVNPFSIGVASGEAGVSIGDGIVLRVVLWVVLTGLAVGYVVWYAERSRRDRSRSIVGFDPVPAPAEDPQAPAGEARLSVTQRWVLGITIVTFALMIFSVIPWSSIFGATAGPAEYDIEHEVAQVEPYWFELNWWFPQLAMLFFLAAIITGVVARMGEKKLVSLFQQGMADMIGPAIVVVLARGVAVIMTNTQTLDTVLNAMEQAVSGASAGLFTVLVTIVNAPLAFVIPSSSGHATLAMPLLAPLSEFAGVSPALTITAYQMGHGFMMLFSPTNVVVIGGLAIAKVGYDKYLRFTAPLLGVMLVVTCIILFAAASLE